MALTMESDIEIKAPVDKFFKRLNKELYHVPDASDIVHGVEVHEGDFETHGSIKLWSYTIDGKTESFKEKIEIDEPNMAVSMVAVGGHILEKYKSCKITYKITPMDDKPALLKVTILYEKYNETDPEPDNYLQFLVSVLKDIDAHLISGK